MTLTFSILLILLGLALLLLEILILPGLVVGIIGVVLMLIGIGSVYVSYSAFTGNLVLGGTLVAAVLAIVLAFRSNTWKKIALASAIDGKVNTLDEKSIKVGDRGLAISRLVPMGKALFNNMQLEVQSMEGFINENTKITIAKIEPGKIWVKKIEHENISNLNV